MYMRFCFLYSVFCILYWLLWDLCAWDLLQLCREGMRMGRGEPHSPTQPKLREIETWLSEADKRSQHILPDTSKIFVEQFLTSTPENLAQHEQPSTSTDKHEEAYRCIELLALSCKSHHSLLWMGWPACGSSHPNRCTPIPRQCTPIPRQCTPIPRQCTPIPRQCTPIPRQCTPIPRQCTPIPRQCTPIPRQCTPIPRQGRTLVWGAAMLWWCCSMVIAFNQYNIFFRCAVYIVRPARMRSSFPLTWARAS